MCVFNHVNATQVIHRGKSRIYKIMSIARAKLMLVARINRITVGAFLPWASILNQKKVSLLSSS